MGWTGKGDMAGTGNTGNGRDCMEREVMATDGEKRVGSFNI
jgi:hypothetical protein